MIPNIVVVKKKIAKLKLYLEKSEGFFDVPVDGEGSKFHLCHRFGDSDDGLELSDGDRDGQALLGVVFDGLGAAPHQDVLVFQFLAGVLNN